MKHTYELPKTERTKVMTFSAFKENKVQDPKEALKQGGKPEKLEKGKDNTEKQGLSKGLKVTKAVYENYTEIGEMKGTLTQVKSQLETALSELQRVSSDLFRKGFEGYSEKVNRITQSVSKVVDEFGPVFDDLGNEEEGDVMFPQPNVDSEVVAEAQGPDAVKDLDKQITELEKQRKQHEMQASQLAQQVNQLIIQRANVEIAAAKTNMQNQQQQQGQPAPQAQPVQQAQPAQQQPSPSPVPANPIS